MKEMYETLWSGDYRKRDRNHGLRLAEVRRILNPSGTVADWGCGHGRLSTSLHDLGMDVIPIDIAENALDGDVAEKLGDKFICGSLPEVTLPHPVEYSICTDVLEHLPEHLVKPSIQNIMSQTTTAAYFYTACIGDFTIVNGVQYNLHPTHKDSTWWSRQFDDFGIKDEEHMLRLSYQCRILPWTS